MLKKYGTVLGLATIFTFLIILPAQAYNLRFENFFDKFSPWSGQVLGEKVESESVAPSVEPSIQPVVPMEPAQPLPPLEPVKPEQPDQPYPGDQPMKPEQPDQPNPGDQPMPPQQPDQSGQNMQPNQPGQPEQNMQPMQNNAQRLKDMQRNLKPLQNTLNNFDRLLKQGSVFSAELQAKIDEAKTLSAKIAAATSAEEISNEDMDSLRELMNTLEEERQGLQRLKEFRNGIKMSENGVKSFEKQIVKLTAQKIAIPAEVSENLAKIKQLIETVKNAKSWAEMQESGVENLGDLMEALNESRGQLEMLARWPQTLKQVDRQIVNLDRQSKKLKTTVDRLLKKNIDLTETYAEFTALLEKFKAVRADAVASVAAGESQDAFDALQNEFFDQMDEVNQPAQIIQTMSNLGTFTSSFKRNMAQAKAAINKLKKSKIDVSAAEDIYAQMQAKGAELTALIKTKPIDQEAVLSGLDEISGLQADFSNTMSDLSGDDGADMPWEQGKSQFQEVKLAPNFNDSYLPMMKQTETKQAQTCNVDGVEMPGDCSQYKK